MRHVVWCSATLSLGAFFYVLTMEPIDQRRNPRAAAIDRVPPRTTLVGSVRRSLGQGQLAVADRQTEALIEHYPEDLDAIFFRAIVEQELGLGEIAARRWGQLYRQTATLVKWPQRYSQAQIMYYKAWGLIGIGQVEAGQAMFRDLADQIEQTPNPNQFEGLRQYNLACYRSMGNQTDAALGHWARAVELGYGQDSGWWMADPDLEPLHDDERFWSIGARLIQREAESERQDVPVEVLEEQTDQGLGEGSGG